MTFALVIAPWSTLFGAVGRVVGEEMDHVLVVFAGDPRRIRFGFDAVELTYEPEVPC